MMLTNCTGLQGIVLKKFQFFPWKAVCKSFNFVVEQALLLNQTFSHLVLMVLYHPCILHVCVVPCHFANIHTNFILVPKRLFRVIFRVIPIAGGSTSK